MKTLTAPAGATTAPTDALIGLLYDAAADPDRWPTFLEATARHFGAFAAEYAHYDLRDDRFSFLVHRGLDHIAPALFQRYAELKHEDPRLVAVKRRFGERPVAATAHCRELVPEAELHASRFYAEVLAPAQIEYAMSAHITHNLRIEFDTEHFELSRLQAKCQAASITSEAKDNDIGLAKIMALSGDCKFAMGPLALK